MKNTRTILLVFMLIFCAVKFSFPQETMTLTLEKSIHLALSQNPYHLAAGERLEAARAQLREAVAGFLPSLNSEGLHTLYEKIFELEFQMSKLKCPMKSECQIRNVIYPLVNSSRAKYLSLLRG